MSSAYVCVVHARAQDGDSDLVSRAPAVVAGAGAGDAVREVIVSRRCRCHRSLITYLHHTRGITHFCL